VFYIYACRKIPTSGPVGTAPSGVRENPNVVPLKMPLPVGIWTPYLIHCSFSSLESTSHSVQPFLQSLQLLQTDRRTDHTILYVAIGRTWPVLQCALVVVVVVVVVVEELVVTTERGPKHVTMHILRTHCKPGTSPV